jgi:hypothetical protein
MKDKNELDTENILYGGVNEISRVLLVPDRKTADRILKVFTTRMIESQKIGREVSWSPSFIDNSKPINEETNKIAELAKDTVVEISKIYPILTEEDANKIFAILVKYLNFAHNSGWQSAGGTTQ